MRYVLSVSGCVVACTLSTAPAVAGDHSWNTASGIGRDVLVAAALGVPAVQGDWTGDLQAGGSMGAAFLVSEGFKHVVHEERPDGSDDKSFPSGHASVSFAAAATLENRYGWKVGLPAFALASFVAQAAWRPASIIGMMWPQGRRSALVAGSCSPQSAQGASGLFLLLTPGVAASPSLQHFNGTIGLEKLASLHLGV
jgi:hypothetical protein